MAAFDVALAVPFALVLALIARDLRRKLMALYPSRRRGDDSGSLVWKALLDFPVR